MPRIRTNKEFIELRKVTPAEWRNRVMQVPQNCRTEVAHIIWWDHFAHRECLQRWAHLDKFLKKPKWSNPTDEQLATALQQCGYSEKRAWQRLTNKMFNKLA